MDASHLLVRYGVMSHVGRFVARDGGHERGQTVVIRSFRGIELGEVLAPASEPAPSAVLTGHVLRLAAPSDLERAGELRRDRDRRLDLCERTFCDGDWPFIVVDVEPLLDDDGRTVLYYLGPHHLDTSGLCLRVREAHALDLVLEPVGRDLPDATEEPGDHGACGTGGCGSCGTETAGGCSGCAVSELIPRANRGRAGLPKRVPGPPT